MAKDGAENSQIVTTSEPHPNHRFVGCLVSDSDARSKGQVLGMRVHIKANAASSCDKNLARPGVNPGAFSITVYVLRSVVLPAQAEVYRQLFVYLPAILAKKEKAILQL